MAKRNEPGRSYRVSIPSIPVDSVRWYLVVFNAITAYLTVANTLFVIATQQITGWQAIQYVAVGELLKAGGVALIISPIITEVSKMVIGALRERRKIEEAVWDNQARWESWNRRRLEAEAKGEPFDEPPPKPEGRRNSSR